MADPADDQASDQERNWRKLEDRAKKAEERSAQLERELAFSKAGLDGLSDKQVKALTAAHDGEITADALKSTAEELGFVKQVSPEGDNAETETPASDHSTELAQLANLASAPANLEPPPSEAAAVAEKLASFNSGEELEAYVLSNPHLFGQ